MCEFWFEIQKALNKLGKYEKDKSTYSESEK